MEGDKTKIYHLTGIGQGFYQTHGIVPIRIFNRVANFHLIPANFPIKTCGIIGMEFLRQNSASLNYENHNITLNLSDCNQMNPCVEYLPARLKTPVTLKVKDRNLLASYLERIEAGKRVLLGESLFRCINGEAKTYPINTTLHDIELTIPPVELHEFETLSETDKIKSGTEPQISGSKKPSDRYSKLMET